MPCGLRRQDSGPVSRNLAAPWDLSTVLDALTDRPFEPLSQLELRVLLLKMALLLALASAKWVSDIHALSVNPTCMRFSMGDSKVLLRPNPAFMPMVFNPATLNLPIELSAFYPPPFSSEEHVRAWCMDKTAGLRKLEQLFVSWGTSHLGKPLTKQHLSCWIVEAISLACESKGLQPPSGLRAYSTRGIATSWALFQGVSMEDICAAARFYRLDVTAPTLTDTALRVGSVEEVPVGLRMAMCLTGHQGTLLVCLYIP